MPIDKPTDAATYLRLKRALKGTYVWRLSGELYLEFPDRTKLRVHVEEMGPSDRKIIEQDIEIERELYLSRQRALGDEERKR